MTRHRTAGRGLDRRLLLKAGGGLALGLARPLRLRAAEHGDVVVLGAGLAGLYSAMLLEELGYRVTLIEASGAVGGRVQTRNYGGVLHEIGASDIGVQYARVIDMARRLELPLEPFRIRARPSSYHVGGTLLHARDWETADVNRTLGEERAIEPARLESHLLGLLNPLDGPGDWLEPEHRVLDVPMGGYLRSRDVSPAAVKLLGHTANSPDIERSSALGLFRDHARTRAEIRTWERRRDAGEDIPMLQQVAGGMQRLPEAMAARLEREVRLDCAAAVVERSADGITVTCRDGSRHRAGRVVCALPLPALRHIEFRPQLSPVKQAAAASGDYYATTKFYLRPTAAFWEQDGFEPGLWSDGPLERVFALADPGGDVHTLLVWINGAGSRRIDQLYPDAAKAQVLDQFVRLRPAAKGRLEVMGYHAWGRDEFIGGCGFTYGAGQVTGLAATLPAPEDRIHFAGEHTRTLDAGMEAAMASAERVVHEIATADLAT